MASVGAKFCPMCTFQAPTIRLILNHLRTVHSSDPGFVVSCGIDGCGSTSKSFSSLYSHIYRHHPHIVRKRNEAISVDKSHELDNGYGDVADTNQANVIESADVRYLLGKDSSEIQRASALFLLKLKEHRRISQVAIDDIVEESQRIFQMTLERAEAAVRAKFVENGFDSDGVDTMFRDIVDPFTGLHTRYLQEKYFSENFGLVESKTINIGEPELVHQFSGVKRRLVESWDTYQYVPILETLEQLVSDDTVLEEIECCSQRIRSDGLLEDFCDGTLFKQHPLFSKDPYALQVIPYFDELELCNPLGSNVKQHKLGVVFFSLGNIHPRHRSQLKNIHLVILATIPIIEKHGLDSILKPFISDMNYLAETGITVTTHGNTRNFRGSILPFLADNLASNDLGGFKKNFSKAYRWCRSCLVTNDSLLSSFTSDFYPNRTKEGHLQFIDEVVNDSTGHFSKIYGVKRRSCLLDVDLFDMLAFGLPHDAMHDILEGVAPLEVKLLLEHCVSNSVFPLSELNSRILNFNYGYSEESDKPVPILSTTLFDSKKSLRLSSSQMFLLFRILPLLIGDKVNEGNEYWSCFLLLRQITDIVFSPIISPNMCSSLKLLISEHHTKFVQLYGEDRYIPKMHFLLHYPEQIMALGPMIRTWTIRHEAKLNFFKQASRLSNFKNIASSLANRHQRWMCYELVSKRLLHNPMECGPPTNGTGLTFIKEESRYIQDALSTIFPQINADGTVFRPTWMRTNGILYKVNNAYLITGSDGLDPVFCCLNEILIINGSIIIFDVFSCITDYFDSHYHAYVINVSPRRLLLTLDEVCDFNVYHAHKLINGLIYISLKHNHY